MRLGLTSSILLASLALACGPDTADPDDPTADPSTSEATESSASSAPTTGVAPDTGDSETATTTGGPDETTTVTDGPVETTEPATTGEPPACSDVDPTTAAEFRVQLDAWPGQADDDHAVDRTCVIDAVDLDAGLVVTRVTCDVDGTPRSARIEISAAPEGVVDWQPGQTIALHSVVVKDEFSGDRELQLTLEGDPAALLLDGRDWWDGPIPQAQQIGPILREVVSTCELSEDNRNELRYSLDSGEFISLRSGFRGGLVIDPSHLYAVDLAMSGLDQFHNNEHSLIRRILSE